ncbi:MAG: ATP phosphoribosyltransferase regulatory subunit [Anaerolineae bacterium]|nr:ATP phosphoribosyltransferase regulatory subunit [Anaerolineae bacterium]
MNHRKLVPGELPPGVADLFAQRAEQKLALEALLRDCFSRWGYQPVIPPTFEYAETLASEAGVRLAEEMYRFFDRDGRALALRPDLTIPTARIAGVKLFDQPLPLRFHYVGSVFRYEEPRAGKRREFTQAGVELIGASKPLADAEVIALLVDALRRAGLAQFRVRLGQIGFFRGLLAVLPSAGDLAERLRVAVDRKSQAGVEAVAGELEDARLRETVVALPTLVGGGEVLPVAERLALNQEMRAAVENLHSVWGRLQQYGVTQSIMLDLGQVRGMAYYTGVLFEVFAPGVGFPLAGGGRYDRLVGHFGPDRPAVGFALTVERLLAALEHQDNVPGTHAVDVVFQACDHVACLAMVQQAREWGAHVMVDLADRGAEDLIAYARSQGIPRVALCEGAGRVRLIVGAETRLVDAAGWESEVRSWIG